MANDKIKVTSQWVGRLDEYQAFLQTVDGVSDQLMKELRDEIDKLKGNHQRPADFRDPDAWIKEMAESARGLALRLWSAKLNPRWWQREAAQIAVKDGTLEVKEGVYRVTTPYGRKLSAGDEEAIEQYLHADGMFAILTLLLRDDGQTISGLTEPWKNWLHTVAGRKANARMFLQDGLRTRLNGVLIPLKYVRKEGWPERYFLTDLGAATAKRLGPPGVGEDTKVPRHRGAVDDIVDVGRLLGYAAEPTPALRTLLPKALQASAGAAYNRQIDAYWLAKLPLLGEVKVGIEVQDKGNTTDLVARLGLVAPFCHFLIVVSSEDQIRALQAYIVDNYHEKDFKGKTIWMTFDQLTDMRREVAHLSAILSPSVGAKEAQGEAVAAEAPQGPGG
jgi:hypothetical protein